ncbi:flagellar basal body-associated FliL family protein [Luteimonas sp. A478]
MSAAEHSRKPPSSTWHYIIMAIVALTASAGVAAAVAWYHTSRPHEPAATLPAPAQYIAMAPPFVVNLDDTDYGPRYLQVEVQLVTREPEAVEVLQHHHPALRARLLMLFAQQTYEGVSTREGKEALQAKALDEVRDLMTAETGQPHAEALLFTTFVTQ